MGKHMNSPLDRKTIRRQLLATASAVALLAWSAPGANAADGDHPLLWIELGGDASVVSGEGQPFTAPFISTYNTSSVFSPVSPIGVQKPPQYSFGGEASLAFQPEDSDWIFLASIRYGRSGNNRKVHQQTKGTHIPTDSGFYHFFAYYYQIYEHTVSAAEAYAEFNTHHSETHTILDFTAGKDMGLGLFGKDGTSVLSAGVRVARFESSSDFKMWARPYVGASFNPVYPKYNWYWRQYQLSGSAQRSFHGIGPTVSWSASVPIAGNPNDGEIAFDMGINAALLFGRQRAKIHHHSSGYHNSKYYPSTFPVHSNTPPARSRSVTVPNIGGFAGISYQFVDAKLSLGYRYDTFLGAMDTGIDTAKKSAMTFKGPYASISIGLGN